MSAKELKDKLLTIAKTCLDKGPGYAQEYVVLREAADQLKIDSDVKQQQQLLTCWHDLFRDGILSWGYDIDNPTSPFFHVSARQAG
jgi:hypothetical protein